MNQPESSLPFARQQGADVLLAIKLVPRASKNEIMAGKEAELRVRVTAPPVDSAANEALVRFLAEELDLPRNRVDLVRGHTSRHKTVRLQGTTVTEIARRFA
jgi:uncharacterized protein (TIGR00251 family)